jgi:leucyl aminopeptidase
VAKNDKNPVIRFTPLPTITARAGDPSSVKCDVTLVLIAQASGADGSKRPALLPGAEALVSLSDLTAIGATGALAEVSRLPGVAAVGLGALEGPISAEVLRKAAGAAARALAGTTRVAVTMVEGQDSPEQVRAVAEGLALGAYSFNELRSAKSMQGRKAPVASFTLLVPKGPRLKAFTDAVKTGVATARGVYVTRDLTNTPAMDLGPQDFVEAATALAAGVGVTATVLDEKALTKGGYGGIVGVGQGSARPPRLLRLEWKPARSTTTVALVGKGIVFDSGGLSLKPPAGMETMKYDMAGAATVLSTVLTAAALKLPVTVVAWCALAENMPSSTAIRPGDVLRHYGGTTVEVLNTDAEGRLVLADALVRAAEESPDLIVDVATLTGAALVALSRLTFAVLGTDDAVDQVLAAAQDAGESAWRLPLTGDLRSSLDSEVADLKNIGGNEGGGTITGALFLKEFVPEGVPWAHLDIAGPGWNSAGANHHIPKGATGVPVRTLVSLLETIAAS